MSVVRPAFDAVLHGLLNHGTIEAHLDELSLSILAYTLYRSVQQTLPADNRMCMDAAASQSIYPYNPAEPYQLFFPPHIQ
jgi:hypothetical protein